MTLHILLCLGIASILMILMRSDFYVSVTQILRCIGWRKRDQAFWPDDVEYQFWTRSQWAQWASLRASAAGNAWVKFVHLITCPYCLTFHASWLTGLTLLITFGWREAVVTICYPAVIILFLRLAKYE